MSDNHGATVFDATAGQELRCVDGEPQPGEFRCDANLQLTFHPGAEGHRVLIAFPKPMGRYTKVVNQLH